MDGGAGISDKASGRAGGEACARSFPCDNTPALGLAKELYRRSVIFHSAPE